MQPSGYPSQLESFQHIVHPVLQFKFSVTHAANSMIQTGQLGQIAFDGNDRLIRVASCRGRRDVVKLASDLVPSELVVALVVFAVAIAHQADSFYHKI